MSSDPVAEKSGFLCMYMSNHPDTLVSYVKYWGKIDETVANAKMESIDTRGMTLSYHVSTSSKEPPKQVRVTFDPPLTGYEEVKPRLMSMKVEAEEELGMVKAPQITAYYFPKQSIRTSPLILLLIYTTFVPAPSEATSSLLQTIFWPGYSLRELVGGEKTINWIWTGALSIHVLESLYTLHLCKKHRTPLHVGAAYILTTIFCGFPAWVELRRRIQAARIESVMKGQ